VTYTPTSSRDGAYFKWEGRASELRSLSASAVSTLRTVDSQWRLGVGGAQSGQERITTRTNIIKLLDKGAGLVPDGNSWSPITMEPFAPSESSTGGRTRTGPEATGARARSDLLEWELASSLALREGPLRVHRARGCDGTVTNAN
jgi:hypothetical protein